LRTERSLHGDEPGWSEGKGGKARHGALKADSLSASSERSGFVASFENTVLIRRPIEEVFVLLSDFENVPKWNSAIVDTRKLSDGPVREVVPDFVELEVAVPA
jgi:uncharacterized membrane protein